MKMVKIEGKEQDGEEEKGIRKKEKKGQDTKESKG